MRFNWNVDTIALRSFNHAICLTISIACLMNLAGCGNNENKQGQSLVRVNGEEITVHQLNDELKNHFTEQGLTAKIQEAERKRVLDALIDRQLLVGEAIRNKMDRDPEIVSALERARMQVLAQAYLQSKIANTIKPSKDDVEEYFRAHPEYFLQRKIFETKQLVIAASDFNNEINVLMDSAKSLEEVSAWLDAHKIGYAKLQSVRTSADFPPQIVTKIQGTDKIQFFILNENGKTVLMSIIYLRDLPVDLQAALPDVMQYLVNKKNQEKVEEEVKRLRSLAKLEYLNKSDEKAPAGADATANKAVEPASSDNKGNPNLSGLVK